MTGQQHEETAGEALRELGAHMRRGSGLALRRAATWWAGDKAVASLVLAGGGWLTAQYPQLLAVEAGVFLVAAYTAREADEQPAEAAPVDLVQLVEWAVAAAHRDERRGVHLAALLDQLHDDELCLDLAQPADLGRALRELGVPIAPQLKLAGTNSPGVRYDELTEWLGRMPVLAPPDVPDLTGDDPAEDAPASPRVGERAA